MKKLFSKIWYLQTPKRNTGVSSIQVPVIPTDNPKDCKDWITIDAPNEVVKKLRDPNRVHFRQAQGTPFTVPPLSEDLNFDGATSSADMILEGMYDSSGLAEITRLCSNLSTARIKICHPRPSNYKNQRYGIY
jgi:hypothetical protein